MPHTLELDRPRDGVVVVRLNRPERLNAINEVMQTELGQALGDLAPRASTCCAMSGWGISRWAAGGPIHFPAKCCVNARPTASPSWSSRRYMADGAIDALAFGVATQGVNRVAPSAREDQQEERKAEKYRQNSTIARRWITDRPERARLVYPEIGDGHFPRGNERSSAGEQPGCGQESRDEFDQAGVPAGPGSQVDGPCRTDGPPEEPERSGRGGG